MNMSKFNLNDHLKECEIITEQLREVDRSIFTLRHKELRIGEELALYLYDSGQATLEYRKHEVETFIWDEEAAAMIADIDNVKMVDLFSMMYGKRWEASV